MKTRKFIIVSVIVILFIAAFAGCGSTSSPSPSVDAQPSASSAAGSNAVAMKNYAFNPTSITIKKGDTVTWTNEDGATHDVVGDMFNSGNMRKGGTFSYTFNETGTFDYECTLHSGMVGKVVVE